jgi:hypothetical protein
MLVGLSVLLHLLHYAIFRDAHHIVIYLLGDLAFLPISVLFVTLVVDQVMARQEKRAMFRKLNMVIGAFFSEAGTELLKIFWKFDADPEYLRGTWCLTKTGNRMTTINLRKNSIAISRKSIYIKAILSI